MSEQGETSEQGVKDSKVTAVEKSVKTKDPRKVELGKRLAKISKEAKERKARQREANQEAVRELDQSERSVAEEINDYVDFRYIVGGVTIVAALGGLYYAYKSDKRFERSDPKGDGVDERSDRLKGSSEVQKVKTINKNDYEITKCNRPKDESRFATTTPCSIENL